jgi:hypothetical protein
MKRRNENAKVDSKGTTGSKPESVVPLSAPGGHSAMSQAKGQSASSKIVWSNYIESRLKHFGNR